MSRSEQRRDGFGQRRLRRRPTAATVAVVGGKLATAAANAATLVVASHALPADAFGVFGGVLATGLILGRLLTLGVDHALLRLRPTPAFAGEEDALVAEAAAVVALASAALLLAAGLLGVALPALSVAVWASAVLAIGWASVEVAYWVCLARRRFARAFAVQAATAAARLLAVLAVAGAGGSLGAVLVAWSGTSLALGAAWLAGVAAGAARPDRARAVALVRYGRWQGFAQTLAALGGHQGVLLLLLVGGREAEAGTLSLAISLCFGVFLLHGALVEHLAMRVAGAEHGALPGFLRGAALPTGGLVLVAAAGLAAVHALGPFLLPAEVWDGGAAFVAVGASALLVIVHAPFEAALHGHLDPRPIFWSRTLRLGIVGVAGPFVAVGGDAASMGWLHAAATTASLAYIAVALRRRAHA